MGYASKEELGDINGILDSYFSSAEGIHKLDSILGTYKEYKKIIPGWVGESILYTLFSANCTCRVLVYSYRTYYPHPAPTQTFPSFLTV